MSGQKTVESIWREGLCCDVDMGDFSITVDEPTSVGGTNLGPAPTSLLLASVASCFNVAIAYYAGKQRVKLNGLSVSVTGKYDGPRFKSITIESRLDCDPSKIKPIVQAARRVCYVTYTLESKLEISVLSNGNTISRS